MVKTKKTPLYVCNECGRPIYSLTAAENALCNGCKGCGGTDIEVY